MKKYNVSLVKNGQLVLSFITYDKKVENGLLKQFKKLKRHFRIDEVQK